MAKYNPIVSRAWALENGVKRYFTGKLCRKGHLDERYTLNGDCVTCSAEKTKRLQWAQKNREQSRELFRKAKAKQKKNGTLWHQTHPEENRARCKANYRANLAKRRKYRKLQYARGREQAIEYAAQWAAENPEWVRDIKAVASARRRSKRAGRAGVFTVHDLREIRQRQENRCKYCQADLAKTKWHLDHRVPLKSVRSTNHKGNIQLLCERCSTLKKDQMPTLFERMRSWTSVTS